MLSDVHSNFPALQAVISDIAETRVSSIWCLGDLVGYGAQPDECVALAAESCDLCLIGNHDLVVLEQLDIARFSANAAAAAEWTKGRIGQESRDFLSRLAPADTTREVACYHGSPRDPVWEYVLSVAQGELCIRAMSHRVGAIGHSHVALYFGSGPDEEVKGDLAQQSTELDLSAGRWLINPGAVGQPRDGDPRAGWLLLDLDDWKAQWRRVEYSIDDAAQAIRSAGLPELLSNRLYYGQ